MNTKFKGLTEKEVNERITKNLVNYNFQPITKSIKQIICDNTFTYFNFLNIFLATAIIIAGIMSGEVFYSLKNCLFMGVIICNTLISTVQEILSKKIIDKLSVISSSKALVIRNNQEEVISMDSIVLDDIIVFKTGNQVLADSIVLEGEVLVNEAFITGESKNILKKEGDTLLSGSFITSGKTIAKVIHVGLDNYVNKISNEATYIKENNSVILNSFEKIIKILSFVIIPVGLLLFFNQLNILNGDIANAIINTVAALIGMLPEGLILLTSSVMAVSVIRLGKKRVLIQELYCIETLSRVNVVCLDKTGTITSGKMKVHDIIPSNKYQKEEVENIILKLVNTLDDDSETFNCIRRKYNKKMTFKIKKKINFSSDKKFSAVEIEDDASYYIGAYEYLIKDRENIIINDYQKNYRVLTIAKNNLKLSDNPSDLEIVGFILIEDEIRQEAIKTIEFFKKQGVDVKIISGDNHETVLNIAKKVFKNNNLKAIDAKDFDNNSNINKLVLENDIFGRVTPTGKKKIIVALKKLGYKTAMTGDGVNDVLALKEADCSVAMASGSDAARAVSQIVLLDNNFDAMPQIVYEGRRTINNIERSSSLLLVKTIYTILLIVTSLLTKSEYFFIPIQLTLISTTTVGIPSFILALEPNHNIVTGNFLLKIFKNSLSAGLTVFFNIVFILILRNIFELSSDTVNSLAVLLTAITGFIHLYRISRPFNKLRAFMYITLLIIFMYAILVESVFFNLNGLGAQTILITIILVIFSFYIYDLINKIVSILNDKIKQKKVKLV